MTREAGRSARVLSGPAGRLACVQRWTRNGWRRLTLLLALLLALTACSGGMPGGRPPDGATEAAQRLAAALSTGQLAGLPVTGDAGQAALDYQQVMSGMSGLLPAVQVADVVGEGQDAVRVRLAQRYDFDSGDFEFTSSAVLRNGESGWLVEWAPGIVHPDLDATSRLYHERTTARRGSIVDATGAAIVENRAVYRVGIDKTRVEPEQVEASARQLAELVEVDPMPTPNCAASAAGVRGGDHPARGAGAGRGRAGAGRGGLR